MMEEADRNISFPLFPSSEDIAINSLAMEILFAAAYTVVFCFGFLGNLIVLLVTMIHPRMKDTPSMCISNLALANLCVGIFSVYQNMTLFLARSWIFGKLLCKMYHFIHGLSYNASILIWVVTAVERYLVIVHSLQWRALLTKNTLRTVFCAVWIFSGITSLPRLYYMTLITHQVYDLPVLHNPRNITRFRILEEQAICIPSDTGADLQIPAKAQFFAFFVIPLLIVLLLYVRIWHYLRARSKLQCTLKRFSNGSNPPAQSCNLVTLSEGGYCECFPLQKLLIPTCSTRMYNQSSSVGPDDSPAVDPEGTSATEEILLSTMCQEYPPHLELSSTSEGTRQSPAQTPQPSPPKPEVSGGQRLKAKARVLKVRTHIVDRGDRAFGNDDGKAPADDIVSSHKVVTRMLVAGFLSFTIGNLPFHLMKLYEESSFESDEYGEDGHSFIFPIPVAYLLMYANCAVNPFLYGLMIKDFQDCLIEFLTCSMRRTARGDSFH